MTHHSTFRQLESARDKEIVAKGGTSPLERWYEDVRDTPIDAFSCGDLCKACRQDVFLEAVLPVVIDALRKEPLAGEMYDGELLAAMSHIAREYWMNHPNQARQVLAVAQLVIPQADDDLQRSLKSLVTSASLST